MKFTGRKILVVSSDIPYPPNHGGRLDTWIRIKLLKSYGFDIDLAATYKYDPVNEDLKILKDIVVNLFLCKRKNRIIDMLSLLPLQVNSRNKLREISLKEKYDVVLLESEYVYDIINNKNLKYNHIAVRLQNDEEQYFKELTSSAGFGLSKLYYYIESFKFKYLEKIMTARICDFLHISKDENSRFQKKYPDKRSIFLPAFTINDNYIPLSLESTNVVFIGSFFMINNMEGLQWYLNKVHPLLNDIKGYKLILAGNSRGKSLNWLYDACRIYENIEIHDSPEKLEPLYQKGAVFINPMLHGTGVKLKTIEAIQNGLPVVSTTVGNQGTGLEPGKDILIEDDPSLFSQAVKKVLFDKNYAKTLVKTAQNSLIIHCNQDIILRNYLETVLK